MWGKHLKRRGEWWHYYRAVPRKYYDVEPAKQIAFALKTRSFSEAKLKAAQVSLDLEQKWERALSLGVSLTSQDQAQQYAAAVQAQSNYGFLPRSSSDLSNDDLIERLQFLLSNAVPTPEQKAVLGMVDRPQLSMQDAYDRFWAHICLLYTSDAADE